MAGKGSGMEAMTFTDGSHLKLCEWAASKFAVYHRTGNSLVDEEADSIWANRKQSITQSTEKWHCNAEVSRVD